LTYAVCYKVPRTTQGLVQKIKQDLKQNREMDELTKSPNRTDVDRPPWLPLPEYWVHAEFAKTFSSVSEELQ
jgi:hypothetical protein